MNEKPPPLLGNGRLLEYAVVDESVTYSGHSWLFVGDPTSGLKELGPVPCLAITNDLKTGEIALLHCDAEWDPRQRLVEGGVHPAEGDAVGDTPPEVGAVAGAQGRADEREQEQRRQEQSHGVLA